MNEKQNKSMRQLITEMHRKSLGSKFTESNLMTIIDACMMTIEACENEIPKQKQGENKCQK